MHRYLLPMLIAFMLTSCGGGGGGGGGGGADGGSPAVPPSSPSTTLVTEWYDQAQTQKMAEGPAVLLMDGSHVRQGRWSEFFPAADGGGMQWQRGYADGVWDQAQPWTEFNADGSWRVDSGDP